MAKRKHTPEQIIGKLREAEVEQAKRHSRPEVREHEPLAGFGAEPLLDQLPDAIRYPWCPARWHAA